MSSPRKSPTGTATRGTTNPNRLRRVDRWMVSRLEGRLRGYAGSLAVGGSPGSPLSPDTSELLDPSRPLVVDLGYGASGVTPSELLARLSAVSPDVRVLGLEIDPARVAAAAPFAGPRLSFAVGGFEVPTDVAPLAIRAFNVLRQYDPERVQEAWDLMYSRLRPGGLLVEGTCDELGRRCAWLGFEKPDGGGGPPRGRAEAGRGAEADGTAAPSRVGGRSAAAAGRSAGTDRTAAPGPSAGSESADGPVRPSLFTISLGFGHFETPSDVAERLPKALIHRNVPGERVHSYLTTLDAAWRAAAPHASFGNRQRWIEMCRALRAEGLPVLDSPARWRLGELTVPWETVAPEE